ncbi:glycoside hydrolase family 18 protein [Oxalobacteraceae bacterium A2-2]
MSLRSLRPAVLAACALALPALPAAAAAAPEIVAYYPGWKSASFPPTPRNIEADKISTLLYAFLDVCWDGRHGNPDPAIHDVAPCQDANGKALADNGVLVFRDMAADSANLRALAAFKKSHPQLKLMVSVGGWNWSNQFSNLADSANARATFIGSAVALLRKYNLDGIDIDWEYPGRPGVPCAPGRSCASDEDHENFVELAREMRSAFDTAGQADRKHYAITIAAGANADYMKDAKGGSVWLKDLSGYLDWINIMSYDYHMPAEPRSAHHAALGADAADPAHASGYNGAAALQRYLAAGVAADKLVLGVPFYGYGWKGCAAGPKGDGQYQPCSGAATGGENKGSSYSYAHLLRQGYLAADGASGGKGYVRYWNAAAQTPYLYHPGEQVWISYEDAQSLRAKAAFVKEKGLRGAMFWELSGDDGKHQLLNALASGLR